MAEPGLRTETFRAGLPMACGSVTLLPIERTVVQAAGGGLGLWCWSHKAPHALIIHDSHGVRVVDTDAVPMPLDRLRALVPGLDALLAAL